MILVDFDALLGIKRVKLTPEADQRGRIVAGQWHARGPLVIEWRGRWIALP